MDDCSIFSIYKSLENGDLNRKISPILRYLIKFITVIFPRNLLNAPYMYTVIYTSDFFVENAEYA